MPIFKTKDLEYFVEQLKLDKDEEAMKTFNKQYKDLSLGQKFEMLNNLFLSFKSKNQEFKSWDNLIFSRFLYETMKPPSPRLSSFYGFQVRVPQDSYMSLKVRWKLKAIVNT